MYGQNDCKCHNTNTTEDNLNYSNRDSISVFKTINEYKNAQNEGCFFKSLILEFEFYCSEKKIDKAADLLAEIERAYKKTNDCKNQFTYDLYASKALFYRKTSHLEKMSEFSFLALSEAEKLKDSQKQIEALNHIVHLFTRMQESEKNWSYIKRAQDLILQQVDSINLIKNYRWLALVYEHEYTRTERKTLLDSTELFINISKKEALKHNINYELALLYRAQEAISYHRGDIINGLKYIDSGIYYAKKIKGIKSIGPYYIAKAYDHWDLGQLKAAEKWTDTAIYYDKKYDLKTDIGGRMAMQISASEIYEGIGETKKALSTYKNYNKLKDSLLKQKRIEIVNELETKYKTELKDSEIKSLSQQQIIADLELTNKKAKIKRLTFWFVLIALLLILLLFITKMIQLKKTRQRNKELKIALERQIQLEKELSDVRDEIAQDFHDDLGNKLARISLLSNLVSGEASIDDPKVKSKLKQITEDANGLYKGTRDFVFSLKSNSDYIEVVATYLSDFGEDFFGKTKVKFIVEKNIDSNKKLPHYWNKQLVFIFKEALTNALKHSKCQEIKLSFVLKNNTLKISCIDDGIGISETDLKSSNGLSNMKNRAQKIGGQLTIDSVLNKGTTITFIGKIN